MHKITTVEATTYGDMCSRVGDVSGCLRVFEAVSVRECVNGFVLEVFKRVCSMILRR